MAVLTLWRTMPDRDRLTRELGLLRRELAWTRLWAAQARQEARTIRREARQATFRSRALRIESCKLLARATILPALHQTCHGDFSGPNQAHGWVVCRAYP
jgi:hypothetical protein